MKNLFNKLLESIKNSVMVKGKESSTRITSYFMLILIFSFGFVTLGIEITSAIVALLATGKYVMSTQFLIALGYFLAHQLTLLGINKNYESKENIKEIEKTVISPVPVIPSPPQDTAQLPQ